MTDLLVREPVQDRDSPSPRQALLPLLESISRALGYTRALVALYDPDRASLRGTVGLNVPDPMAEGLEVPLEEGDNPLVMALLESRPLRVDHVPSSGLREHAVALLSDMAISSFVVAPLRDTAEPLHLPDHRDKKQARPIWKGREIPAVGVVLLSKEETITDADIDRLMPFATQAGTTLARVTDAATLRDSSERHAIENEWLWRMIDGVADPLVLTDATNDIILHNRRAETLFRTGPDDSEGKQRAISMNNFLFTALLSTSTVEQNGSRAGRELTLIDPIEGTELLFEVISYPATNYRNGARGKVSVLKNITDLRYATEELSQNVQRLQTKDEEIRLERDRLNLLLRSVPNPIIMMDNDNQIITMNHEALRLFQGLPESKSSSRRAQISLSNDTKFTSFVVQLRLDTAQDRSGELVLVDPDTEETLTMAVTSSEVRDELGAVVATVSVMQDVSRLRELEQRRVEQILFESEKLAATGRLAASIAHEINNPLEAIKNSLYLVTSKISEEDPTHKFLQIATKETERVSHILRQMLGFYRPPKMELTDVNSLIEEAESLVEKHLRQRGVRLENDLSPHVPPIIGSADQLKQVILNLLLNAQQAMPDGGVIAISTRAAHQADPDFIRSDSVQIQIRDSGTGIAEEHVPHIFEPFFSTKHEQKGTGMGLWVSHTIIQNHGGSIKVRSREGRGTTFSISLPIGGPTPDAER